MRVGLKANITLALAAVAYLAVYPWREAIPGGGLIASGLFAALVGGAADWFAVSALFRRPLGIPLRTRILVRNRAKVTDALVDLVQNRLLTREALQRQINGLSIPGLLVDYMEHRGGKQRLAGLAGWLVSDITARADPRALAVLVERLLEGKAGEIELMPLLDQAIDWSLAHGHGDKALQFVLDELAHLAGSPALRDLLESLIAGARRTYQAEDKLRTLVLEALPPSADLAGLAHAELCSLLASLRDPQHPLRAEIHQRLAACLRRLPGDLRLRQQLQAWLCAWLGSGKAAAALTPFAGRAIAAQVDRWWAHLQSDDGAMQRLDAAVKRWAAALVDERHALVGDLVRASLDRYSDRELVALVEERVGDDLQWIRINGAVIGGLVGAVLHLVIQGVQALWPLPPLPPF